MTPERQNTVIAEACGWTLELITEKQASYYGILDSELVWFPPDNREWDSLECPDYCGSLDAIYEPVMALEPEIRWRRFYRNLCDACGGVDVENATAAQRAEAYLKTIDKWEGESDKWQQPDGGAEHCEMSGEREACLRQCADVLASLLPYLPAEKPELVASVNTAILDAWQLL